MKTRNTLLVTALVGAFTLLGAGLFLAETPSQVSAQSQAAPASGAAHPQAVAARLPQGLHRCGRPPQAIVGRAHQD